MPNPPNLILAVLDTARADEVLRPGALPGIRALADHGTVFSDAISPAPWTLPSHASLFSGLLPHEHGLTGDLALAGGHLRPVTGRIGELANRWVPVVLQRAGYQTFGASANPWITRRMGFGAGFDRFVETGPAVGNVRFDPSRKPRAAWLPSGARRFAHDTRRLSRAAKPSGDSGAGAAIAAFRAWMRDRDGTRPFFAFFNFMEPHLPYSPSGRHAPPGLGKRLRGARLVGRLSNDFTLRYNLGLEELAPGDLALLRELYRGEIAGLDERLSDLRAAAGDSVIVAVGDHGENLGDHHQLGHQTSVADTLLRVPLVVSGAGVDRGTQTEPFSTAAVAGTLLHLAGQNGVAGPTLFEATPPAVIVSQYESAYVEAAGARALADGPLASDPDAVRVLKTRANAVRMGQIKMVARSDGSRAVFDLEADPAEERDVAADRPDLLKRFADLPLWLDPPAAALSASEELPQSEELAEIEQRLESLGYL